MVDSHMESLSGLFNKRRKITFSMEFIFKEATSDSAMAKGKKKKQSATEAQKLQRAADARLLSGLDVAAFVLYPCAAACHMALQARHLSNTEELEQIMSVLASSPDTDIHYPVLDSLNPSLRERAVVLQASFQVSVVFCWVVIPGLFGIAIILHDNVDGSLRPRRKKLLLWMLLISLGFVNGCFGYLMSRCGFRAICAAHFGSWYYFYDFGFLLCATPALLTMSSNFGSRIMLF